MEESLIYNNALKKLFEKLIKTKELPKSYQERILKRFIDFFGFICQGKQEEWSSLSIQQLQRMEYILVSNLALLRDLNVVEHFNCLFEPIVAFCSEAVEKIV